MTSILALDTSGDACSVALGRDGAVWHRHTVEPRAHHRLLLPMVEDVFTEAGCAPAELDAVAFGCGPGSFTGLRIATAVTQAIAWAHDLTVIGVSTLEIMAASAVEADPSAHGVIALLDARMGECYWNLFRAEQGQVLALQADGLAQRDVLAAAIARHVATAGGRWLLLGADLLGDASQLVPQQGELVAAAAPDVDARMLLTLAGRRFEAGEGLPAREAIPRYLRDERRWRRVCDPLPQADAQQQ